MSSTDGYGSFRQDPILRVRCPRCRKRLARIRVRLDEDHGITELIDLETGTETMRRTELGSHWEGQVIDVRGLPLAGSGEELVVPRKAKRGRIAGGQRGPLTGYHEAQRGYTMRDGTADFDRPPSWTWHCPCGAVPRVTRPRMLALAIQALAVSERDINL
jgi:hypothetical protein